MVSKPVTAGSGNQATFAEPVWHLLIALTDFHSGLRGMYGPALEQGLNWLSGAALKPQLHLDNYR